MTDDTQSVTPGSDTMSGHHWMFTAQVVFVREDDPEKEVGSAFVNATVITDEHRFGVAAMMRGQQMVQHQLRQRMGGVPMKVVDVVMIAVSHLGLFTREEFLHLPPGMQRRLEEMAAAADGVTEPSTTTEQVGHA